MKFLRRLFGSPQDDVPVRLLALAPTVPPSEVAKLEQRPVRRPSGSKPVLVFGARREDGTPIDYYAHAPVAPKPISDWYEDEMPIG